jgi:hypothetical protein
MLFRHEIPFETVQRGRETAEKYGGDKPYNANIKYFHFSSNARPFRTRLNKIAESTKNTAIFVDRGNMHKVA